MTKKNLLKKKNEFIEYEEQILCLVKQRFVKYIFDLSNLGLSMDIGLLWLYQGEDLSFSRLEFKDGYECSIHIQIRRKEESQHDLDLEALTYIHPISRLGMRLFHFGSCYSMVPKKIIYDFFDTVENSIKEVLETDYNTVLNKFLKSNLD